MTEDPFVKIKEMLAKGQIKAKEAVDRIMTRKDSEERRRAEYVAELKECAKEGLVMMGDSRYPKYGKFLKGLREEYARVLESLAANMRDEYKYEIVVLGANVKLLDMLMNRPADVIKELKAIEKANK